MRRPTALLVAIVALLLTVAAACSTGSGSTSGGGKVSIVAAESFWGSIARQLGGDRVAVTQLVNNPNADPHDYEPTPSDARDVATAQYVILNGLGYDSWASDLVSATPSDHRTVLEIGSFLGLHTGDNPHRWYFPDDVARVIDRIASDLESVDPADASYFAQRRDEYTGATLRPYRDLLDRIRSTYSGTPVGATESIVEGLTEATGLALTTPTSFLDAITQGEDPNAHDKVTVDSQITGRQISVLLYNGQNATPDVQRLVDEAHDNNIPVVTVTETPVPAGVTFQDWQVAQLQHLIDALAEARG